MLKQIAYLAGSRWLGVGSAVATYALLSSSGTNSGSSVLWLTNLLIFVLSLWMIYGGSEPRISIKRVTGGFALVFFALAPVLEYTSDLRYWGGGKLNDADYMIANWLLIIALSIYTLIYHFSYRITSAWPPAHTVRSFSDEKLLRLVFLSIAAAFVALYFYDFDFARLAIRGGELKGAIQESDQKSFMLLVDNYLRPLSVWCAVIVACFLRTSSRARRWFPFFLVIALIVCAPTGLPRFAVAGLYIPLVLVLWPDGLRNCFLFINFLLLSFVTVFPFLNAFRSLDIDTRIVDAFSYEFFLGGHFDAYQNLVRTIEQQIVTGGEQLVGAIFFFVPRAIWHQKPIGSGELLAERVGLFFSNISQSLPAEGYVNFGATGLLLFVAVAGAVSAWFDKKYRDLQSLHETRVIPYYVLIGLTIFIWRGDFVNAVAYTSGFMLSFLSVRVSVKG